ncbi:MAG: AraC family transcriptional regulator [Pedobacter sp.]|nr:MAG: AraC family transcriptional regulator [Pedobacter sp.]
MTNFPVLTYLLLATITVTFGNFYFWFRADKKKAFNWLIFYLNIYLFTHAVFVFTVRNFFFDKIYFNTVAPFVLVYGPLLYIAIALIRRNTIKKSTVYLHVATPVIVWLACLVLIVFYGEGKGFYWTYNIILAILTPISLITYSVYGVKSTLSTDSHLKRYKLVVMPATLLLIFMSLISIIVPIYGDKLLSNADATDLISMMIYSLMFATAILIFKYKTSIVFNEDYNYKPEVLETQKNLISETKYERSTLTLAQLEAYRQKLTEYTIKNQPYLDSTLSLAKLAKMLRMPSHHLTQVLSTSLNQSFYTYVNTYRIEYAIKLLLEEADFNMNELAMASGFSSKVSFYRQFKNIKGCTPAVYKSQLLKK